MTIQIDRCPDASEFYRMHGGMFDNMSEEHLDGLEILLYEKEVRELRDAANAVLSEDNNPAPSSPVSNAVLSSFVDGDMGHLAGLATYLREHGIEVK